MIEKVPRGWSMTSLSEIAKITMGQSPSGEFTNTDGVGFPLVGGAADFRDGKIKVTRYTSNPTKVSEPGDIVLCIRATIGKLAFADEAYCLGRGVAGIRPHVDSSWLFYKLLEIAEDLDSAGTGSTFRQIDKKTLESWPIPLPPHPEQIRIVDKIRVLILKVAEIKSRLENIIPLLEKYREAILISGFNGKLTANWRSVNDPENSVLNTETNLPISWQIKTLAEVSEIQTGLTLGKKRKESERTTHRPYLRVANVQRGHLDLSDIKYAEVTKPEFEKLVLRSGDILMNEGGDRDKLGRGWIWDDQIENCIHQNHVFRVRLKDSEFPSKWISFYSNEFGQKYFFEKGQQTTNLASISKTKLSALPIPMPPVGEANEIVKLIDRSFLWMTQIESEVNEAIRLSDVLFQSILEKANRGDLLPQNVLDDPASNLLRNLKARIDSDSHDKKSPRRKETRAQVKTMTRKLHDVLAEANDWLSAQDAFKLCGVGYDATTEEIEPIYSQMRDLDQNGYIDVETVRDEAGKKLYDRIKLNHRASHAS